MVYLRNAVLFLLFMKEHEVHLLRKEALTSHNKELFSLQLCFLCLEHLQLGHQLVFVGDAQVGSVPI